MAKIRRRETLHPVEVAAFIDFLDGFASDSPTDNPAQTSFRDAMLRVDPDRRISRRLVRNFNSIPPRRTAEVFGKIVPGRMRSIPVPEMERLFSRPTPGVIFSHDDVGPVIIPEFPAGTEFSVLYTGLYCKDDTFDRSNPWGSDEPYVITVAVTIQGGNNVERAERHPVGDPDKHYGDVDPGESRNGPVAAVWSGIEPQLEISLVTVVMEKDEGDPDAYKDEIRIIVAGVAALAAAFGFPIAAPILALVGEIANWLIDSEDDEIGTTITVLSPDRIKQLATQDPLELVEDRTVFVPTSPFTFEPKVVTDNTGLEQNFVTRHTSSGHYVATFKVVADRDPVVQPPGGVAILNPRDMVVANF